MASSPTDARGATPSPTAFLLQELIACWNQGYEALARGDLERVTALLDIADEYVGKVSNADRDSVDEARWRTEAAAARGRLEHGMKAGLQGLQEELATVRRGGRALRGYSDTTLGLGSVVTRQA